MILVKFSFEHIQFITTRKLFIQSILQKNVKLCYGVYYNLIGSYRDKITTVN